MKINDIWNKFLELRKSPAFILFALMGLFDITIFIMVLISYIIDVFNIYEYGISFITEFLGITFFLFFAYMSLRIPGFLYYMSIILGIFIIEKFFKFKINNNFINNKTYIRIWKTGFIVAIICSFLLPFISHYLFSVFGKGV